MNAVEVSLEENRAERGSIGYVDMQVIFRLFPQTQKAKENFEEVVRQTEDQVGLRKSEIISLRAEIAQLKAERDFLAKNPVAAESSESEASTENAPPLPGTEPPPILQQSSAVPTPAATPAPSSATVAASSFTTTASVIGSTQSISTSTQTLSATSASTVTASGASLSSGTTAAPMISPPSSREGNKGEVPAAPPSETSPRTAVPKDVFGTPPIRTLPGISVENEKAGGSKNPLPRSAGTTTLAELDRKIAEKTKSLQDKEGEFKTYQAQVEKNLLDLESRRTEILLGKIYGVVQQVARDEGVSVVVDKSQILFGHKAVDLTPKVLEKLKNL